MTTVTNGVFSTTEGTTNTPTVELVTNTSYTGTVADLVGEGKKYKTLEALAASHVYANEFIETLKKENKEKEEKLEKAIKTEELFNKLTATKEPVQTSTTTSLEDIQKIVLNTITQTKTKDIEATNVKTANDTLVNHFGTTDKAKEYVENKSKELGLSINFLMDTAAKSPTAFYNIMEVNVKRNVESTGIIKGTINTEGKIDNSNIKFGSEAYYNQMYKTDPRKYNSPQIQKQIQESAAKGTYFS